MHKHLTWALPQKCEQNTLTNSLHFQDKEIIFTINKQIASMPLTINFQIKADFDKIGPQNLEFHFVLKKNDEIIFSSRAITRKYKTSFKPIYNQSLTIAQNKIFDQNQDIFVIEIDVQELELSSIPTPNIQKVNSQVSSNSFELTKDVDVNKIATPEHLFSPIRLKDKELILEDIDRSKENASKPILTKSNNFDTKSVEKEIKDPIPIIAPINVNNLIIDSPKKDDNVDKIQSSDSDTDSNSTTDDTSTSSTTSPFSAKTEKKKKRKKKKLSDFMSKIKKFNDDNKENHIKSESQPVSEPPKSFSFQYDTISRKPFQSESQSTAYPKVSSPDQDDSSTSDDQEESSSDYESEDQQIDQDQSEDKDQPSESYCGLFNQGATCYMNSMLQAFYHLPAFRRLIYRMDTTIDTENESKEKSIKSNIPLQLQKLFATMQTTKESACSTRDLTRSFGWSDEDTIMQHDVQEFCRVILDNLETKIDKQPEIKGSIQNLFRGKVRSYIRCTNVKYESKRDEYFYDLSLDVKGCKNLKESFYKYIEKEKLNGKNQYDTGDPSLGKQDAEMGNEFVQFPPVLHLHLLRFDYNATGTSKIYSRFEFPLEINLGRFMAQDGEDRDEQIFDLFGVLVHHGTVEGGHYYAFLRPTEKQKWYEFNDSRVSLSTIKEAVNNNYGGSSSDDFHHSHNRPNKFNKKNNNDRFNMLFKTNRYSMMQNRHDQQHQMEHQRFFSAYMLIYIRKKEIPFLYQKVSNDEIPDEIRELIAQQEELRRKREEEKRIQENTVVFHIYRLSDIGNQISNTKKFAFPNPSDFSIGNKFTALRDEKYSVLYDKVLKFLEPPVNEDETEYQNRPKISFEFWPITNFSIGMKPIDLNQKISFPSVQSLLLYFNTPPVNEEEEQQQQEQGQINQLFSYPYILLFIFVFSPALPNPILPIKVIKVKKSSPVRVIIDDLYMTRQSQYKAIYKSIQAQMVEEITDFDLSFDENKIKNGSFIIFEEEIDFLYAEKNETETENVNVNEKVTIKKYHEIYKSQSFVEYLDIIRNTISFRLITTDSEILKNNLNEYQIYFPRNRNFGLFVDFLKFALKIPQIKTIILYEMRSKTPFKFKKEQCLMDVQKFDSLKLFQFDSISKNVFEHSLLIQFRIIGSLVDLTDSTFNCWMNEDSTIADLTSYIENSYVYQLKVNVQNQQIYRRCRNRVGSYEDEEEEDEEDDKERIKQRVIMNYRFTDGLTIRVFTLKKESAVVYPPDTKLMNTESTLLIDIPTEDQFLFDKIIMKDIERIKSIKEEKNKNQHQNQQHQNLNQNQNPGFLSKQPIIDPVIVNDDKDEYKQLDSLLPFGDNENDQIDPVRAVESEIPFGILTANESSTTAAANDEGTAENEAENDNKEDLDQQYPRSVLLHVFVSEITMNKVCGIKETGNSLISVFDGETIISIRKRIAYLLNKDEEFFIREDKFRFSFALFMPNNQYMKIVPKEDEPLFPLLEKGYTKLKVTTVNNANRMSVISSSSNSSFSKDDSVVIKN